uniref:Nbl1_Borealin_N domain-containing protein n=1 Tax=Rhabditophanes sp. KR3021 TaxID=114890 RepID=A0AC35U1C8_9BILA
MDSNEDNNFPHESSNIEMEETAPLNVILEELISSDDSPLQPLTNSPTTNIGSLNLSASQPNPILARPLLTPTSSMSSSDDDNLKTAHPVSSDENSSSDTGSGQSTAREQEPQLRRQAIEGSRRREAILDRQDTNVSRILRNNGINPDDLRERLYKLEDLMEGSSQIKEQVLEVFGLNAAPPVTNVIPVAQRVIIPATRTDIKVRAFGKLSKVSRGLPVICEDNQPTVEKPFNNHEAFVKAQHSKKINMRQNSQKATLIFPAIAKQVDVSVARSVALSNIRRSMGSQMIRRNTPTPPSDEDNKEFVPQMRKRVQAMEFQLNRESYARTKRMRIGMHDSESSEASSEITPTCRPNLELGRRDPMDDDDNNQPPPDHAQVDAIGDELLKAWTLNASY